MSRTRFGFMISHGQGSIRKRTQRPARHREPDRAGTVPRSAANRCGAWRANGSSPARCSHAKTFQAEALQELVDSIRERGVIQPLIVREVAGKFELIAGERRWRAAATAGLAELPVIVRSASDPRRARAGAG